MSRFAGCGMTLIELLIASSLAVLVMVGIGNLDVARTRMAEVLKERSGIGTGQGQAALGSIQFARAVQGADRLNILATGLTGVAPTGTAGQGKIQLRTIQTVCPTAACLDGATYRWDEYRWRAGAFEQVVNTAVGCGTVRALAQDMASVTFRYRDESLAPPGGEPFPGPDDNNILEFLLRWDNGRSGAEQRNREFRGRVASRLLPYSDVRSPVAAAGDSGSGLTSGGPPPPAPCP
jgi:hypothetical protein